MLNMITIETHNLKLNNLPFGYERTEEGLITILEDEAMLVREIYRLFLEYGSYDIVCRKINYSENFPNHPYTFNSSLIREILHDTFYVGDRFIVFKNRNNQKLILRIHHDQIIPNEIWEQVKTLK